MWGEGHMIGMGFGWFFWILLIAVVIWVVVRATGQQNPSGDSSKNTDESARELLDKRYARGEIDEEEYTRRKNNLTQ